MSKSDAVAETLRINLASSNKSIHDLQDDRKQMSTTISHLQSDLDRTEKKLVDRTERWMESRDRHGEKLRNMKLSNAKQVDAMKLQHSEDMATVVGRMESELYRKDRSHTKTVVALDSEMKAQQKSNELVYLFMSFFTS